MAAYIRSSPPPAGQPPLQLAGEPERRREAEARSSGIEMSDNEWAAIVAAARRAGVANPEAL